MENYFAAKPPKEATAILLKKAEDWSQNLFTSGYIDKLKNMNAAYHGTHFDAESHQISFSGEQGELVNLAINHIRNLASHIINMTTSNRPSMETRAINNDYKSKIQCRLANGILEYYMREKRLETYLKNAVEYAVVLGAGWIKMGWNATTGEIYDYFENEETGESDPSRPIYEGDIEFTNLSPFDVVMDGHREDHKHDWLLVRTFKNKYDLAAKYPEFAEKIIGLATKSDQQKYRIGFSNRNMEESDEVSVYEFYHKKSDSLPNGRYLLFLDEEIVLQDIGLPYRTIPIFRIAPSTILGTPYGYTPLFDILPVQDAINSLYSTILTNQSASGIQNFWSKPGNNLSVTSLSGGLNLIESMEEPKVLNLCNTPAEVFKFLEILERVAETLSGINSVARGNPEKSLQTGAALALVQSMALQFMSGLQQSYVGLVEDVGGGIISILKDYAKAPRLVTIVGKSNRTEMEQFSSDDISNVTRVFVDVGNPLSRTIAGRMELAQQMMQYQVIKNPQQLIEIMNTGRLESITDDTQTEFDNITLENEMMMEGELPIVVMTDDHRLHILEHKKVFNDPELRKNNDLMQTALTHLQNHINELKSADPDLLMILGQQPIAPTGVPQMPPTPEQGQVGLEQQGEQMQGPGLPESGVQMPNVPTVDPNLLPNSSIEPKAQ